MPRQGRLDVPDGPPGFAQPQRELGVLVVHEQVLAEEADFVEGGAAEHGGPAAEPLHLRRGAPGPEGTPPVPVHPVARGVQDVARRIDEDLASGTPLLQEQEGRRRTHGRVVEGAGELGEERFLDDGVRVDQGDEVLVAEGDARVDARAESRVAACGDHLASGAQLREVGGAAVVRVVDDGHRGLPAGGFFVGARGGQGAHRGAGCQLGGAVVDDDDPDRSHLSRSLVLMLLIRSGPIPVPLPSFPCISVPGKRTFTPAPRRRRRVRRRRPPTCSGGPAGERGRHRRRDARRPPPRPRRSALGTSP